MITKIEVVIGDGAQKPRVVKRDGQWVSVACVETKKALTCVLWARTWDPANPDYPISGGGLFLGRDRRLKGNMR